MNVCGVVCVCVHGVFDMCLCGILMCVVVCVSVWYVFVWYMYMGCVCYVFVWCMYVGVCMCACYVCLYGVWMCGVCIYVCELCVFVCVYDVYELKKSESSLEMVHLVLGAVYTLPQGCVLQACRPLFNTVISMWRRRRQNLRAGFTGSRLFLSVTDN